MVNKIELHFDENLKVLAGNDFGREIYENQMKGKFKEDEKNEIIFPDFVEIICSSFVQGLFSKLLEVKAPTEILNLLKIDNPKILKFLRQGLYE